jgi:AbrB family looped-hinge helix DNA binding protein
MKDYRLKIGEGGRIVIPAFIRKELHVEIGEELVLKIKDHELRLISAKQAAKDAQKRVTEWAKGVSLVKKLKDMRKEDNHNE